MKPFAIALLAAALTASAELPPFVKSAFEAVDSNPEKWAFTQTTLEDGSKTVETFDPSKPEGQRWQLVLKDSHAPGKSELAEYAEQKKSGKRKGEKHDLSEMIRPGSLHLISESATDSVYEFRMALEGEAQKNKEAREIIDLMKGRLTIAKNGPWLRVLEIENEKPIKPVTAVRLDRMYTKMTFHPPAPGFPAVIAEVRAVVRGRALLVKKLDHDSVTTYTNYRVVGGGH